VHSVSELCVLWQRDGTPNLFPALARNPAGVHVSVNVMVRSLQFRFVTAAISVAALWPAAFAQTAVTPATSPVLAPSQAEKAPPPAAPKRNRAISSEVAAALAAASPKYTPPPPKPEPKPEEQLPDMREIDKPKNTIVRLPKVIVREPKPPIFTERSVHTEKGLTDIAVRRYISDADRALNRFTLPLFGTSMEARAMAMYAEDERLRNMSELRDAAIDAGKTDPATGDYIRKESQKTYLRSSDFGWSSGPPR
jgi:hypothetical protein